MKLVLMTSWYSSWHHFGAILGSIWVDFGSILESSRAQRASWELSESWVRAGSRFSRFQPPHFEGFWRPPGRVFGDIFVFFLDIDFAIGFHLLLRWFFIDFHALRINKNEQIRWEVLQKLSFRLVSFPMCLRIGFGNIFFIFFGYTFCNRFPFAFKMIFHRFSCLPDKQKWANSMGGPAKIKLSFC